MKKKVILISFFLLYLFGTGAAVAILIKGTTQASQTNSTVETLASLSPLSTKNKESIGLIQIDSPISFVTESPSLIMRQRQGASFWLEQMKQAETNENIKAVIIRVNSPGGTVGASQELHAAVMRIQAAGKPVITSVADLSASGGYYATVSSDRIFANPGSLVGSIGVILGGVEFSELLSKIGIKYQAITSGVNKDILSPYKAMTPEQNAFLQRMVNNTYEQFLTAVSEGRKKDKEVIRPLADGSVFTGEQAVENGLIDALGSFEEVVAYTKATYQLENAEVRLITPQRSSFQLSDIINIITSPKTPEVNLINTTPKFGYSPVLYLYQL